MTYQCDLVKTRESGGQWFSWLTVRLGIEGLLVGDTPPVKLLCCVLEQDTLSSASTGSIQEDRKSSNHV